MTWAVSVLDDIFISKVSGRPHPDGAMQTLVLLQSFSFNRLWEPGTLFQETIRSVADIIGLPEREERDAEQRLKKKISNTCGMLVVRASTKGIRNLLNFKMDPVTLVPWLLYIYSLTKAQRSKWANASTHEKWTIKTMKLSVLLPDCK